MNQWHDIINRIKASQFPCLCKSIDRSAPVAASVKRSFFMKITYLDHSGFLVESTTCYLLFDFVKGNLPTLQQDKPLYIFASHFHADHFSKRIYETGHAPELTTLFLGKGIFPKTVPDALKSRAHIMKKHEGYSDALIRVGTLDSNDSGVAFIVEIKDTSDTPSPKTPSAHHTLYFAGDLNAWYWDGDEEDKKLMRIYHEELMRIKGRHFDLAFIPLDPRLKQYETLGISDFFEYCTADVIIPMHCWGEMEVITRARENTALGDYRKNIWEIRQGGDTLAV